MTASMILSSVYGYDASYPSDSLVELVESSVRHLSEAGMPAKFYVNTIPWLKYIPSWFPGAGWKRKAEFWRAEKERTINEPYEWTKSQMAAGTALPSIVKNLVTDLTTNEAPKYGIAYQEDIIRWVAGTFYPKREPTRQVNCNSRDAFFNLVWNFILKTVASMATFLLAMVLYPQVQKRAQAELDAVLGEDRLPELRDRERLPYISSMLKEIMRWFSVVPLGVPRTCTQDNVYKGFFIPKGAIVLGNIWAMSNDPSTYPEPDRFDPERFLKPEVPEAPAFRVCDCPGSHFAEASLFLMSSTLLTVFNVVPTPGKPAPVAKMHSGLLVSHPAPFDCTVLPL
ncbi:cytochrome P450 family protein [Ceratobasidium sp. AG-Ba]|nr:cytochrome P450 family protein [Ceratobasidium sp. AG-Ba]